MLGEISQTEKDKYHIISLIWNLKNKKKINVIKEKQSHR